jgi:hypothetical protein
MEKLIYLVWMEPGTTRHAVAEAMLSEVAPALLGLGPHALSMDLRDTDSDIPAPVPTPDNEVPLHALVSVWLDTVEQRAPYETVLSAAASRLAGYQVVESLYRDYGDNEWSTARDWPDGERSPGVLTVALLEQHPDLDWEEWIARWHGRISPITERLQPRTRYVRNAVFRAVTHGAPPFRGIVEEAWPSLEHVTDPMLFYRADGDPARLEANLTEMLTEITSFIDINAMRSVTMSEWILKSSASAGAWSSRNGEG